MVSRSFKGKKGERYRRNRRSIRAGGFVTSVRLDRLGYDAPTKRAKSERSAGIEPTTPRLLVDKTIEVLWTTTVPTALHVERITLLKMLLI
jgi:hypothetical protein